MEESNKNVKIYVVEAIVGDKSRLERKAGQELLEEIMIKNESEKCKTPT